MGVSCFEYKGYIGTIEPDVVKGNLFGMVAYIRDLITFEAETVPQLKREFELTVDEYLSACESAGKAPDTPFEGTFNVRAGSELHRAAVMAAGEQGLNAFVCEAIKEKLERQNAS